jgi:hypothetical protein
MQLEELRDLLQNYPLNSFIGTSKAISINQDQIALDMEQAFSEAARGYLYGLSDLVNHNDEFLSDNPHMFCNYLSRLIGTTCALRDTIQIGENLANIFESELTWARGLALRGMITILDKIIEELIVARNQTKGSRFINRIRDKVFFIMSQKIPQILYILTTIIAIESEQIPPSEIVLAIGKGMQASQTCR